MRAFWSLLAVSILLISATLGCRPSGPTEEMGTVVNEIPTVEGAEEPYVIPQLGPSPSDAKESEASSPSPAVKPEPTAQPAAQPAADAKPKAAAKPKG